jgi:hypothetical protein
VYQGHESLNLDLNTTNVERVNATQSNADNTFHADQATTRVVIQSGSGDDSLFGGLHQDRLDGGEGHDFIDGGSGNDRISGGAGNDQLWGGDGQDRLEGGAGADELHGGAGNDTLYVDSRDTLIDGGEGIDTVVYQGYDSFNLDLTDAGVERVDAAQSTGHNVFDAQDSIERVEIRSGSGSDTILGGQGRDVLDGGLGNDRIQGGAGNDQIRGGVGDDQLLGGAGKDRLMGDAGADQLFGGAGNDFLSGGQGDDWLDGAKGYDVAEFSGNMADYQITALADGNFSIVDSRGIDGTDRLVDVQELRFANGVLRLDEQLRGYVTPGSPATAEEHSASEPSPVSNDIPHQEIAWETTDGTLLGGEPDVLDDVIQVELPPDEDLSKDEAPETIPPTIDASVPQAEPNPVTPTVPEGALHEAPETIPPTIDESVPQAEPNPATPTVPEGALHEAPETIPSTVIDHGVGAARQYAPAPSTLGPAWQHVDSDSRTIAARDRHSNGAEFDNVQTLPTSDHPMAPDTPASENESVSPSMATSILGWVWSMVRAVAGSRESQPTETRRGGKA